MADNEKITTKLEVDVTDFKKGLSDANRYIRMANSEFEKATAGVGKFTDSADGLRSKLTQLEKTLEGQEAAAAVLRHEYERVCKEQGENSKGAQELAIKLNKQEAACKKTASQIDHYQAALDDMEAAADDAADSSEDLGDGLDEAGDAAKKTANQIKGVESASDKAGGAVGGFVKKLGGLAGKAIVAGIKGIAAAAGGLATAFLASGETSKEWIGNMNKLEAVAQDAGRSTEDVKAQFTEFYGILGDETAATTTTSNLEAIGLSQENLASVTNSMAGIWSKYGDSIPLDGLAESINETSKVGQVTGNLADALNWAGISEDQFNEKLAACSSEQERQQLIVDTLDGTYGKLGETYKEQNAAIIESNKANAALQDSMSGIGEVAMPIMSTLKMLGASLLNDLLPGVKELGTAFQGLLSGDAGAAGKLGSALSGLLTTLLSKVTEMAPAIIQAGISLIESLLGSLTSMAPQLIATVMQLLADITVALIGMIPEIAQLGMELWLGLMQGLTTAIPQIVQAIVDMIPQLVQALVTGIPLLIQGAVELLMAIVEAVPVLLDALIPQIPIIIMAIVNALLDNLGTLLQAAIQLLLAIVQAVPVLIQTLVPMIPTIVEAIVSALVENLPLLLDGALQLFMALVTAIPMICLELLKAIPDIIAAILSGLAELPAKLGEFFVGCWEDIKEVFAPVGKWFKDKFSEGSKNAKNAWSNIGKWASETWGKVTKAFASVGSWFKDKFTEGNKNATAAWSAIGTWASEAWGKVKAGFASVGSWFKDKFTEGNKNATAAWSAIGTWASEAWGKVKTGFASVGSWFKQKFDEGNKNAKNAFSGAKSWASSAWGNVKSGFGSVSSWFRNTFADAWAKIKAVFAPVGNFFGGIWNTIKSKFTGLGSSISNAIGGAVKSGINGIISSIEKTINKGINLINGAIGLINEIPGVSVGKIKKVSFPRLYRGGVLKKGQVGVLEGSGAEAVVPLEKNRQWIRKVAQEFMTQMGGGGFNAMPAVAGAAAGATYNFYQYNTSPKALSRREIYRQTKNQLRFATQ